MSKTYLIPLIVAKCPGCSSHLKAVVTDLKNGNTCMALSCANEPSTEAAWYLWSLVHAEALGDFEGNVAPLIPAIIEWIEWANISKKLQIPKNPRLN